MSEHGTEKDAPWKCPKPDCDEGIDAHNLARFLDHMHYDEPAFTAEDAQDVADRVLARLDPDGPEARAARVTPPGSTHPGPEDTSSEKENRG